MQRRFQGLSAATLMMVAGALIAWTSVVAKALGTGFGGEDVHPLMVTAGRFVFAFLALLPVIAVVRPGFTGAAWPIHIGRVVTGWGGATLLFASAALIPLADANAIAFLAPVVTIALSAAFLGERIGRRWGPAAIALTGALILTRPGTDAFRPAALLAFAAAASMGTEMTFVKRLSNDEPVLRILAISNGLGTGLSVSVALVVFELPTLSQAGAMALLGLSMLSAQVLFVTAMQRSDASAVAPFLYLVPLYAAAYDWLLFSEAVSLVSAIGVATIITGAALLAARERPRTEPGSLTSTGVSASLQPGRDHHEWELDTLGHRAADGVRPRRLRRPRLFGR